jgi:SAM-dependent methyltransferase
VRELPFPDDEFDIVVVNSVLHMLPSTADVRQGLREALRVCRPGGHVWVGELPFRPELDRGIARHLARHRREYGLGNFARLLFYVYVRPVVRGEPVLLYPARNQHVPREEVERWCRDLDAEATCLRHEELARESETRNDYLITVGPGAE